MGDEYVEALEGRLAQLTDHAILRRDLRDALRELAQLRGLRQSLHRELVWRRQWRTRAERVEAALEELDAAVDGYIAASVHGDRRDRVSTADTLKTARQKARAALSDAPAPAREGEGETVHLSPTPGLGVTRCCGRTPFELPRTDRITNDAARATCRAGAAVEEKRGGA